MNLMNVGRIFVFFIYIFLGVMAMNFFLLILIKIWGEKMDMENTTKIKKSAILVIIICLFCILSLFVFNHFKIYLQEEKISQTNFVIIMTAMICLAIAAWIKAMTLIGSYSKEEKEKEISKEEDENKEIN